MPKADMLGGMEKRPMPSGEGDGEGMAKEEAGKALKSALESGDGKAICEAVKTIMDLESYEE